MSKKNALQTITIITNQLTTNKLSFKIDGEGILIDWGDGCQNDIKYHYYYISKAYEIKISAKKIFLIDVSSQNIKIIKFENCIELFSLKCQFNSIYELDVSGLSDLENLKCNDNKINKIKFGNHEYLYSLSCEGNQLNSLHLSGHADNIQVLNCAENNITDLDLHKCSILWRIDMRKNPIGIDEIIDNLPDNSAKDWLTSILLFDYWGERFLDKLKDKNWTLRTDQF